MSTDRPKKSRLGLKLVSVVLAILLWIYIGNQGGASTRQSNIKADIEYLSLGDGLSIKQAPDQVSVQIWGAYRGDGNAAAAVDLEGLGAGTHLLPVELKPIPGAMFTRVEPREVEVVLTRLQKREFKVEYQISASPPEGYELLEMVTNLDSCIISGEANVLSKLSQVVCPVNLSSSTGVNSLRLRLEARDARGNVIKDGISIVPETVEINAVVGKKMFSKELAVKGILKGSAAEGYQVRKVNIEPARVGIIANQTLPDELTTINTAEIDLSGRKQSFSQEVSLQAPSGTKLYPSRVLVEITIEKVPAEENVEEEEEETPSD